MKKIKMTVSLLLTVTVLALANINSVAAVTTSSFKDVKSTDWHYNYVTKLINLKITSGYPDGTYRPNNSVTRAEFVTFLCKTLGHEQAQGDLFVDTKKHWATGYISIALANGITELPADKKFRPDVPITRLEAAEMICRAFNLPKDLKTTAFVDVSNTEKGYANTVYNEYLMVGSVTNSKRYFYPKSSLKRSEAAAIVVNMADYKANSIAYKNSKIEEFKEKQEQKDAELVQYQEWKDSVKNIPVELLGNNQGLYKDSLYLTNKYMYDESGYLSGWGKNYGYSDEKMANEIIRIGESIMNLWYNADYRNLEALESGFKNLGETNFINNSMKRNLDYVKNNKFVSEGSFKTNKSLIVVTEGGSLALRGTIRYRYLSPTSSDVLNSEIVEATGKPIQLGVWYEQDYQISFYPENSGLKFTSMRSISDIRTAK